MRTIKKFPKSPIRPAGRVLTVVKHQICSPSCRSRLYEHLSFNVIENLLCLGFISLCLRFCYVIFTRSILSTPVCDALFYYMEESVLLGTKPLVDSIRHFIRDPSGVFSVCHLCECRIVQWRLDSRLLLLLKWFLHIIKRTLHVGSKIWILCSRGKNNISRVSEANMYRDNNFHSRR